MTELIFENYCINCEKLCNSSSIYCSNNCASNDASHITYSNSNYTYSPLLSPIPHDFTDSMEDLVNDEINLNYNLSSNNESLISTSNNYKKWLNLYVK
ncbi:hypothetical protein CLIB1444_03S03268 [[Candida] jaroonii]|uniref:Uncharacterized protein n=1 Tax=[Candida] jaroonii TaxID=467808 RepID=A0ACA9Y5X1_9ASCO|nr:hypothetical protein CLIB1444_03S03268 [[Candida] jaroonii]